MNSNKLLGIVSILLVGLVLAAMWPAFRSNVGAAADAQVTPASVQNQQQLKHVHEEQQELPPAPVAFDPPVLDLGTLRPGERTSGEVRMRNIGDTSLRILTSRASCSCTSVNLNDVVLAPGESIAIPARFNGKTMLGEKKEEIRIQIEGYALVKVPIHVTIDSPIQVDPPYINGLSATKGQLEFVAKDGKPFRLVAVNGATPKFVGFNPSSDEPRTAYTIEWDLSEYNPTTCVNSAGERMRGWYLIETDHPEASIIDVEVRSQCTRRELPAEGQNWLLAEKSIQLGRVAVGEPSEFTVSMVWIRQSAPDDAITAVATNSKDIDVELVDVHKDGSLIEARIRVTPKGDHRGALYAPIRVFSSRDSCPMTILGQVTD